ncbi:MAG: hypothetical protein JSV42_02300, partial [Chloroflexota bacterium]
PLGVFYSRSDDGGQNWTAPLQLGGMDEGQPAIDVFKDEVHVLWNGDASKGGRYYRFSNNAGLSWQAVEILSPPKAQGGKGGLQRPPGIIVDNQGRVHVLLHEQESLNYTSKINESWSAKQSLYFPESLFAAEIFAVRMAITGGNNLHAFFLLATYNQPNTTDRSNLIWNLFHQSKIINAESEDPLPLASMVPEADLGVNQTEDPGNSPEGSTSLPLDNTNPKDPLVSENSYQPARSIYIGVLSVGIVLTAIFVILIIKQRK